MKKIKAISLVITMLILISGCAKTDQGKPLSNEEASLSWSKKQDKPFSLVSFPEVSEEEAKKLMKENYDISVTDFYMSSIKNTKEAFSNKEYQWNEPIYRVKGSDQELIMHTFMEYQKADENLDIYGSLEAIYKFDAKKKENKLRRQSLIIIGKKIASEKTKEGIELLLQKESKTMKIVDSEKVIKKYQETIKKPKDELAYKTIRIYDDSRKAVKDKTIGRIIQVVFNSTGEVCELEMSITDYSD